MRAPPGPRPLLPPIWRPPFPLFSLGERKKLCGVTDGWPHTHTRHGGLRAARARSPALTLCTFTFRRPRGGAAACASERWQRARRPGGTARAVSPPARDQAGMLRPGWGDGGGAQRHWAGGPWLRPSLRFGQVLGLRRRLGACRQTGGTLVFAHALPSRPRPQEWGGRGLVPRPRPLLVPATSTKGSRRKGGGLSQATPGRGRCPAALGERAHVCKLLGQRPPAPGASAWAHTWLPRDPLLPLD